MKKYNSNLLPEGYFSKRSLPYWCLVLLDSLTLVAAGMLSLYLILGGYGVLFNFWDSVGVWMAALPIFLLFMHLFRTYVGALIDRPLLNLMRIGCALFCGGVVLRLILFLIPDGLLDYLPGTLIIGVAVIFSTIVQWSYRMVARYIFATQGDAAPVASIFFSEDEKGQFQDTTIRTKKKINLCLAHMSEDGQELRYVKEAFDTNWVVPLGPNVNAFEQDLEAFVNPSPDDASLETHRVVALSAGTAAVHLALRACGVVPGDEVIVQSFTFCASANPVAYLGAVPVFVDSEPETWNMDPQLLDQAIRDRIQQTGRKPKAIIPVALYGMPYKVDEIMAVADRYDIPVIEDAAEGFGSRYKGRVLGTFGKYGVMSFNGNKMITTSGGGALICEDDHAKKNILWYATQARESYPYYQHEAIGYNYRLSNVCAGIGRGQMTVVRDHIAHHKHVQKLYEELLADVPGVTIHRQSSLVDPESGQPVFDSNYWLCAITLDEHLHIRGEEQAYSTLVQGAVGGAAGVTRVAGSATTDCQPNANVEALRVYLDQAQIEARPLWKPMHRQPVYRDAPAYVNGVSEALFRVGMCLPAGPCVTDDDVRYIVSKIREAIIS